MANERLTEGLVRDHFKSDPVFLSVQWEEQKSSIKLINELLSSASKNANAQNSQKKKQGYPEFIISFPTNSNYLIVVECKALTSKHESLGRNNPKDYAVDGVLHYAKFLSKEFNVVAIAVSGETNTELKVSNFYWKKNDKTYRDTKDLKLLSISDYLQLFEDQFFISNFYTRDISFKAKELNEEYQAYSIPTTVRCTFVSAVLMSLLDRTFFEKYKEKKSSKEIIELMLASIDAVLQSEENLVRNKNALITEYSKLSNEPIFSQQNIKHKKRKDEELTVTVVKTFISYLERNVYPLVAHPNIGYDFLGRFYTEFIRYAGSQQKQGLVLTPQHITQLFCDLVHLTTNDVVYDPCCGTGGFLVAALERMFKLAGNDQSLRKNIREKQICGVELRPDMFTYACSNMKFRGDGKSNIYNGSCFTYEQLTKDNHKPTIAFLNPPYDHGLANQMEFVEHALNVVAPQRGTVVAIVQQSCAFKDETKLNEVKQRILSKHRLKAVLSMPIDLFYPVGVVTCIMVFEANKPNKGYKTWLGYFREDGFEKKKNLGRVDWRNRYKDIHDRWMSIYDNLEEVEGLSVRHEMSSHVEGKKTVYDEWCAEAYMKTDYSDLSQKNFQKTLSNYLSYLVRDAGYITDLQYIENYINYLYYKLIKTKNEKHSINLNTKLWKEFKIQSLFDVVLSKGDIKIDDVEQGNIPLISSGESNNGIIGYINEDGDDKAEIFKGNAITVDMFCNAFYQKLPFYAVSHGRVNILLPKFELTSNIALFICTLIKHEQYRFSYGRAVYSSVCEKIKIKLPALLNSQTNEYEPDWQFMETYIKNLPYGNRI